MHMATIHISAAEAARDFTALLAHVRAGAEVTSVDGSLTVAVLHTPAQPRRSIEECIALLPEDSPATIDEDFARDVAEAVTTLREPLNPPAREPYSTPACSSRQSARAAMHGRYSSEIAGRAAGQDVAFSVVTLIELAHGAARADTAERKTMRRQFLLELTTAVPASGDGSNRSARRTDRRREHGKGRPYRPLRPVDRGYSAGTRLPRGHRKCASLRDGSRARNRPLLSARLISSTPLPRPPSPWLD